jgi:hypothetical protein
MTQVLQLRPNPYSEALAGVHCGILPALLLASFANINTHEAFLMYLFLGSAIALAMMYFMGDLTLQFAVPCIGSYTLGLGLLTKAFTDNVVVAAQIVMIFGLVYCALHISEHLWRKRHP